MEHECPTCGKVFSTEREMANHSRPFGTPTVCTLCDNDIKSPCDEVLHHWVLHPARQVDAKTIAMYGDFLAQLQLNAMGDRLAADVSRRFLEITE